MLSAVSSMYSGELTFVWFTLSTGTLLNAYIYSLYNSQHPCEVGVAIFISQLSKVRLKEEIHGHTTCLTLEARL